MVSTAAAERSYAQPTFVKITLFIFLSKFLPPLVYPLGLTCILILAALLLARRQAWMRAALVLALALLLVGGNSWVSLGLARSLEWRYLPSGELPKADAIVVLGGGTQPKSPPRPMVEVNGAGDRVLYGGLLYKQGKAEHILLSGGGIDWLSGEASAAQEMASLLELMGVPKQALWLESKSQNTYENALYSREILEPLGIHRILLVTSAWHMPRSVALYERQGFVVIPAPVDFHVTQEGWDQRLHAGLPAQLLRLLPGVENLSLTTLILKEYLGMFVYHLRGWL